MDPVTESGSHGSELSREQLDGHSPAMSAYFGTGWNLLQHINVVHQTRELVRALLRCHCASVAGLTAVVTRKIQRRLRDLDEARVNRPLSQQEIDSLSMILQTVRGLNCYFKGNVTADGHALILHLQRLVYGQADDSKHILEVIAFESTIKASIFRYACIVLLRRLINSNNCFSLLGLGYTIGCKELEDHALLYVLHTFCTSVRDDFSSFLQLDVELLLHIFQNNHLQVPSERPVLDAILSWVQFSPNSRIGCLHRLLEECTSLGELEQQQLVSLSQNPLVLHDQQSSALVARTYIKRCLQNSAFADASSRREPDLFQHKSKKLHT